MAKFGAGCGGTKRSEEHLAIPFEVERAYTPDREAMLGALRVLLRLPNPTQSWLEARG
jgi:hypothetical protein